MFDPDVSLGLVAANRVPSFYGVVHGNGVWVANGNRSVWRSADDGLTWQQVFNTTDYIEQLSFANGRFFFNTMGRGKTSTDGLSWEEYNIYYTRTSSPEAVDIGTIDAYAATIPSSNYQSYYDVYQVWIQASSTNTGACTFDLNGLGPLPVVQQDGVTPVLAGTIEAGKIYLFTIYWTSGPDQWTVSEVSVSQAIGNAVNDFATSITHGNGTYVAYGEYTYWDGAYGILSSTDLSSWQLVNTGLRHLQANIRNIRYINGRFYAVGEAGTFLISDDGVQWEQNTSIDFLGLYVNLTDIAFDGTTYLLFGDSSELYASPDGDSWTAQPSLDFYDQYRAISTTGSIHVFCKESSQAKAYRTSDGGSTWEPVDILLEYLESVDRSPGGTWMVGDWKGNLRHSTNGENYTTVMGNDSGSGILTTNNGNTVVSYNYLGYSGGDAITGIRVSTDGGYTWSSGYRARKNDANEDYLVWIYGGGVFLMTGLGGRVITSPDGMAWTDQTTGVSAALRCGTYSGGLFLLGGDSGTIITSSDGVSWSTATVPIAYAGGRVYDIGYNGSLYLAIIGGMTIISSANGSSWSAVGTLPDTGISIEWTGTAWIVGAQSAFYYKSTDNGASWSSIPRDIYNTRNAITAIGSRLWTTGAGILAYSDDDAATWTSIMTGYGANGTVRRIWQVPTGLMMYHQDSYNQQCYSADGGETWADIRVFPRVYLRLRYLNGKYLMASYNQLLTSDDGMTWQQTKLLTSTVLYDISYDSGVYVAVGNSLSIWRSTDGMTWTWIPIDGTRNYASRPTLYSVMAGGGMFAAIGSSGKIYSSPDGLTWTARTSPVGTSSIFNGTYGNGQFVAISLDNSQYGQLVKSSDGASWTATPIPGQSASVKIYPTRISHDGTYFLLCGLKVNTSNYDTDAYIASSLDGITWNEATVLTATGAIVGVNKANDTWYAIDSVGGIHTSPVITGVFEMAQRIGGYIGEAYQYPPTGELTMTNGELYLTNNGQQIRVSI